MRQGGKPGAPSVQPGFDPVQIRPCRVIPCRPSPDWRHAAHVRRLAPPRSESRDLTAHFPGLVFQERPGCLAPALARRQAPARLDSFNWPGCFLNTHPEHPRTFLAARKTQLAKIQVTWHSSRKGLLHTNRTLVTDPTRTGDICGAILILLYCLSIQPALRQGLPYGPPRGIRAAPLLPTRAWHPGYDNAP